MSKVAERRAFQLETHQRVTTFSNLLTDWFARKNVDDRIKLLQYLLLSRNRFVQLLLILFPSNLEGSFLQVRQADKADPFQNQLSIFML